jgi:hypothetical protein
MCEEKGAKMAEELDYIPMADNVVKLIEKTWSDAPAFIQKMLQVSLRDKRRSS